VCLHAGRYPPPALDFDVECGPRRYHLFPVASSFDDFDDFDVSAKRDERTREDDSDDDDTTVPPMV